MVASLIPRQHEPSPDLLDSAAPFRIREVHLLAAPEVGLKGIVAIHSTARGPALGGTRCLPYPSLEAAALDAFRLARGMSYKAAIHDLPLGGGKAVLLGPPPRTDRQSYFEAWGKLVHTLGGRFITAEDSGTNVADMDAAARNTPYVVGTSALGDPSPYTAQGVRRAMQAALKFRCGSDDLDGVRVAIQGTGHVGYRLAVELVDKGARVTVADTDPRRAERCGRELGARIVPPEQIYDVPADVFAPCALGGTVNRSTLERLDVAVIAGSANNQLADEECARISQERGVLYVPDYVANGGGLMKVAAADSAELPRRVESIYELTLDLCRVARAKGEWPLTVANRRAEALLDVEIR